MLREHCCSLPLDQERMRSMRLFFVVVKMIYFPFDAL